MSSKRSKKSDEEVLAKRRKQTSTSVNKYKKERKANRVISKLISDNGGDDRLRVELKVGNKRYCNMPEWTHPPSDTNPGNTFVRKIVTRNIVTRSCGFDDVEFYRFQPDGAVVRYRSFIDVENCNFLKEHFLWVHLNCREWYICHVGFWKEEEITHTSNNRFTRIIYYEDEKLSDNPTYVGHKDVDEAFETEELAKPIPKKCLKLKKESSNKTQ